VCKAEFRIKYHVDVGIDDALFGRPRTDFETESCGAALVDEMMTVGNVLGERHAIAACKISSPWLVMSTISPEIA
jgi:hypothetical protein